MAEKRLYVRIQNHDDFLDEAAEAVAAWLEENATFTGDVVVDKSFLIEGAAADAREVGLEFTTIKNALNTLKSRVDQMDVPDVPVDLEYNIETSQLCLVDSEGNMIGNPVTIVSGSGGITDIDLDYDEETGQLSLVDENGDTIGNPVVIQGGGGGGAVGSKLTFSLPLGNSFTIMESASTAPITYKFRSIDTDTQLPTGNGTLQVMVNNVVKANLSVPQGDANTVDVVQWLTSGANTVKLTITDQYGMSASRTVTYYKERFELEWNLDDTIKSSGALSVSITPYGSGTKTIYVLVDGTVHSTHTVTTTGRRFTVSLELSVGAHDVQAYGEMTSGSVVITSNTLTCAVAQTSDTSRTPVVAASLPVDEVTQYDNLVIPYRVVDPQNNPAEVILLVNGAEYDTINVDQSSQTWTYRPSTAGQLVLAIRCGSASWTKTLTVKPLSGEIEEITDGLALKVDPNALINLNAFTLSDNFDTTNGGLQNDDENVRVIKVCRGDRLTVPYTPFGTDVRVNGADIKINYKVENSSDFDAEAITCWYGGIGFKLRSNDVILASEQTTLQMDTCEGYKTELDMSIEKRSDSRLMSFWEGGIRSRTKIYGASDSFSQQTPSGIVIGSDDCDVLVYGIRCYTRDLTGTEVVTNFIADGKDASEIQARYSRNQIYDATGHVDLEALKQLAPKAHIVVIDAAKITGAKDDKVPSVIHHYYPFGGDRHTWSATCDHFAQGTSSLNYKIAGCNIDFKATNGFVLDDGQGETITAYAMSDSSFPVNYFNIKTDVASESHVNNMLGAQHYQDYQPSVRASRVADARTRDTIEAHMAIILFRNTGSSAVEMGPYTVEPNELAFYGLGTFGNSKKSKEAFQYEDIVVEVDNNTSLQCRFKSDDLSTETWDGKANFEFRYLNEDVYSEETAKGMFQQFLTWAVSCDHTTPTNVRLPQAVIYDGTTYTTDTAAYRRAKFKAEAANWMDLNSVMYHKIWTNTFSARDNRAKNMFWAYNTATGKWGLWFHYDSDTILGLNNEGDPDIRYGKMDIDTIGTGDVFNAADSNIFVMLDQCFLSEQMTLATTLENAGAFDLDGFADECDEVQSWVPEVLWNADADRKVIDVYKNAVDDSYIDMQIGKSKLQRRQFCTYQEPFMCGYYENPSVEANTATIRAYTPSEWTGVQPSSTITVTTYTDLWLNYKSGSFPGKVRCTGGVPVTITLGTVTMNDTENYIRSCDLVQSLGDISNLYPGYVDVSKCKRMAEAIVGSSVAGYVNSNLTSFNVANAKALELINLEGCSGFSGELDLSNNIHVKEVYTRGSACSGVTFADNGRLETAQLNAIGTLYAHGLKLIETFQMVSFANLTTINIVDSPALPAMMLLSAADSLQRIRLIDVDWDTTVAMYDALVMAYNALGIDDDGYNTEHGVITGAINFDSIGDTKFNTLQRLFPDVEFTRDVTATEYSVVFYSDDNETTELFRAVAESGTSVTDPVAAGLIEEPYKAPDEDYVYDYFGWDKSLQNITGNLKVHPTFQTTTRYNTVRYIDSKNGAVLETYTIIAHGSCYYHGADLENSGYVWIGWDKEAEDVVEDMDILSVYIVPTLPAQVKDVTSYDYVYSDDTENYTSAYTKAEFYSIIKLNKAEEYGLTRGRMVKMVPHKALQKGTLPAAETSIDFQCVAYGHFEFVAGGMSHCDFLMKGLFTTTRRHYYTSNNTGGYAGIPSEIHTWLEDTLYPNLDPFWKALIEPVKVLANAGNQTTNINSINAHMWIPSAREVGIYSGSPYNEEISEDANEQVFSIFTDAASRIKKTYNGTGASGQNWWTRSAYAGNSTGFASVGTNGGSNSNYAGISYSVCAGFSA